MEHAPPPAASAHAGPPSAARMLLVGPGPRLARLLPLLAALRAGQPHGARVTTLADVAEALTSAGDPASAEALELLLDADHVPVEDIGIVRRFLESRASATLVLLGQDASRASARTLLSLARTRWMAWPPDVEQLHELAHIPHAVPARAAASAPRATTAAPAAPTRAEPAPELREQVAELTGIAQRLQLGFGALRESAPLSEAQAEPVARELQRLLGFTRAFGNLALATPRGVDEFDLDALLEEELAVLALKSRKAPRFRYRGGEMLPVRADRAVMTRALGLLLGFAQGCAGEGELVRVSAGRAGEAGCAVVIEFPAGRFEGIAPRELLSPSVLRDRLPEFAANELAGAAALLRSQGGLLELTSAAPDELAFTVQLPLALPVEPTGSQRGFRAAPRAAAPGRTPMAADPFA